MLLPSQGRHHLLGPGWVKALNATQPTQGNTCWVMAFLPPSQDGIACWVLLGLTEAEPGQPYGLMASGGALAAPPCLLLKCLYSGPRYFCGLSNGPTKHVTDWTNTSVSASLTPAGYTQVRRLSQPKPANSWHACSLSFSVLKGFQMARIITRLTPLPLRLPFSDACRLPRPKQAGN